MFDNTRYELDSPTAGVIQLSDGSIKISDDDREEYIHLSKADVDKLYELLG